MSLPSSQLTRASPPFPTPLPVKRNITIQYCKKKCQGSKDCADPCRSLCGARSLSFNRFYGPVLELPPRVPCDSLFLDHNCLTATSLTLCDLPDPDPLCTAFCTVPGPSGAAPGYPCRGLGTCVPANDSADGASFRCADCSQGTVSVGSSCGKPLVGRQMRQQVEWVGGGSEE